MVKEVRLALQQGYQVTVVCFEFDNWSHAFNQQIKESLTGATLHVIPAGRKPFLPWAVSVFGETFFRIAGNVIPLKGWWLSQAVTRRTMLLKREVRKLSGRFDLVIGHNPGALYPVYIAGKKFGSKTGFDVEDYHPGEGANKQVQRFTKKLMNTLLPEMDYVTFAAPLMKERHAADLGREPENWHTVLNLFHKDEFEYVESRPGKPLQLLWFSQNVNYQRGLEALIPALAAFEGQIELTLIGNKKEPFYSEYVSGNPLIKYIAPMKQDVLNRHVCSFDVGLAIEPGKDYNNIIALSNKLITYFQAGLFVLASDTPAHKRFFQDYPAHGRAVPLQKEFVRDQLAWLLESRDNIIAGKKERFDVAEQHNWESESEKLLKVWRELRC